MLKQLSQAANIPVALNLSGKEVQTPDLENTNCAVELFLNTAMDSTTIARIVFHVLTVGDIIGFPGFLDCTRFMCVLNKI